MREEKGKTAVTQVELIDGERVFGDYDEGVLEKYKLTDEDIDYIKNFDVVICDVWGKVEGQFKELKEKGIVRKGRLEFIEKNKSDKKVIYVELTEENEKQLEVYIQKIDELIQQEKVPECLAKTQQCKKCAYYEYCYI